MTAKPTKSTDTLIIFAYWATLALAIVALLCAIFLGLLLMGAARATSAWVIVPFLYTGLAWLYLEVLAREYRRATTQFSLPTLGAITLIGAISLLALFHSMVSAPHNSGTIAFIPFAIGCVSLAAVLQITAAKYQARKSITPTL